MLLIQEELLLPEVRTKVQEAAAEVQATEFIHLAHQVTLVRMKVLLHQEAAVVAHTLQVAQAPDHPVALIPAEAAQAPVVEAVVHPAEVAEDNLK